MILVRASLCSGKKGMMPISRIVVFPKNVIVLFLWYVEKFLREPIIEKAREQKPRAFK